MKAVGIELVPQSADDATVKAAISEGNFELAFNTNGSFGGDPVFLSVLQQSAQYGALP